MVLGTCGIRIVKDDRETVARGFAEFDVPLDDGFEDQFLEMFFHFIINLVGQTQAAVIHGQQETFDFQRRVEFGFDNLDRIEKFADTFQCEIFTLDRDDYGIGCRQCVYGDET